MDGNRTFGLVLGLVVLYALLFLSLWPYRQWIGMSLLVLVALGFGVWMRGWLVEQDVRLTRYHHQDETPLDAYGEPSYWHEGTQVNPHRMARGQRLVQQQDEGYQPYEPWRGR